MSQVPNMRPVTQKTGLPHKNSKRTAHKNSSRAKATKTPQSRDHLGRVKQLDCAVCAATGPSDAHHILEGRIPNRKSPDWLAIPLCKECHTGPNGIHGNQALWMVFHANELLCLNNTLEQIYG